MDLEPCSADYSLLPAHIITRFLMYLNVKDLKNASSVCKSWYYASTDPQIVKTLVLKPTETNFPEICKSHYRFGILKLQFLAFDKMDSHYFELFEKFCPFVYELYIHHSDLKLHHLLKLFEFTTRLERISLSECNQLITLPSLFPLNYDCDAKNKIVKNLSGVKYISIEYFNNISLIADLLRCAINLQTFSNEFVDLDAFAGNCFEQYLTILSNDNIGNLRNLNLELMCSRYVDDFIVSFLKIQNLNLRSFRIVLWWNWKDGVYKHDLFYQLILKLQSLVEFVIDGLGQDQLSLICQHLVNLKSLECRLRDDEQPISELANLKQLEKLYCHCWEDIHLNFVEIDNLFKNRFIHLRIFNFDGIVTESNLKLFCENHTNLIELKLTRLLTKNLEIIFQHLTKLRVVSIYFDFTRSEDSNREYKYKISRLNDLEEFFLGELIYGIREEDVGHLKKLRLTNLLNFFVICKERIKIERWTK